MVLDLWLGVKIGCRDDNHSYFIEVTLSVKMKNEKSIGILK